MNDTFNIPKYTFNQTVFIADFDNFEVCKGLITRRCYDAENEQYEYYFNNYTSECNIPVDEEDIHKTFAEAKNYMINVVSDTLKELKLLSPNDIKNFEEM